MNSKDWLFEASDHKLLPDSAGWYACPCGRTRVRRGKQQLLYNAYSGRPRSANKHLFSCCGTLAELVLVEGQIMGKYGNEEWYRDPDTHLG